MLDHASLATQVGVSALNDPRYEALGSLYFSPGGTRHLARLWTRSLLALTRTPAKALVVDLDNVLWGGTLGEDGAANLKMSVSGQGFLPPFPTGAADTKGRRRVAGSVLQKQPDRGRVSAS